VFKKDVLNVVFLIDNDESICRVEQLSAMILFG